MSRVALVGAGLSGLVCARALQDAGLEPVLFEKSRGPGGRMSSRRDGEGSFDHGAQFFTVRHDQTRVALTEWLEAGVVAPWQGRFGRLRGGAFSPEPPDAPRYVGAPRMSALTRHLSRGLDLRARVRVGALQPGQGGWRLVDVEGQALGDFERVLVSTPPAQAAPLLRASPPLQDAALAAQVEPCQALMVRFESPLPLPFDAARVEGSPLGWVARDSSKPGRGESARWVLHASPGWSREHLEDAPEAVTAALLAAFAAATGCDTPPAEATPHRWRYALAQGPFAAPCGYDAERGLGACGDWWVAGRVEGAYRSGRALAERVLRSL
ncbi:MAG: FAD-dependent oxidoreductase [Alphaproteobacteria bacterium]|nr:FAD-dependent oxidoreductase [Alphaproteobacteria bacterium]